MKRTTNPTAIIIALGDELMTRRPDTNGVALAAALTQAGILVKERLILPDQVRLAADEIRRFALDNPIIICCGGLGPTQDDVTREALAQALDRPLVFVSSAYNRIRLFFKQRRMKLPAADRVQAMIPHGAKTLNNHFGTAPGFWFAQPGSLLAALPGPPRECLPMFHNQLLPVIKKHFKLQKAKQPLRQYLRTCGVSESKLQELLGPYFPINGPMELSFLIDEPGEILVGLSVRPGASPQARAVLARGWQRIRKSLGKSIIGAADKSHEQVVGNLLAKRGQTLAVAESCTGGLISRRITSVAGSSGYFLEGAVTYANGAKIRRLGVPEAMLKKHGAVSPEVAKAMAAGIRKTSQADWGIGVTGIAGPGGGTRRKPAGLVYISLAGPKGQILVKEFRLGRDRDFIQRRSASLALNLLRLALQP